MRFVSELREKSKNSEIKDSIVTKSHKSWFKKSEFIV